MTDNAVLYTGRLDQCAVESIAQFASGAKLRVLERSRAGEWRSLELVWKDLSIRLNEDTYEDPEMLEAVQGVAEWAHDMWAGESTAELTQLLRRLTRSRRRIDMTVEPELDEQGRAQNLIFSLARPTYSIVAYRDALWDPQAQALMEASGEPGPSAALPHAPGAQRRRERTLVQLAARGIEVPDTLALLEGEEEALVTDAQEVARRAALLWALSARADAMPAEQWQSVIDTHGDEGLTEEEAAQLEEPAGSDAARELAGAQREAVWALLWALGRIPAWTFPDRAADSRTLAEYFRGPALSELVRTAALRDMGQLLDARDQTYCLQWASLEAMTEGVEPPAGIQPQVVEERLRALHWVMLDGYAPWEDVSLEA
jgi:Domain of unknown function (DUF4272)